MNQKDKINSKIEDLEAELEQLKKLANEPEKRTPKAGDVWADCNGTMFMTMTDGRNYLLMDGINRGEGERGRWDFDTVSKRGTFLGKFDEVYVKKSDVIEALSVSIYEDSFLGYGKSGFNKSYDASRKALAKLGITK